MPPSSCLKDFDFGKTIKVTIFFLKKKHIKNRLFPRLFSTYNSTLFWMVNKKTAPSIALTQLSSRQTDNEGTDKQTTKSSAASEQLTEEGNTENKGSFKFKKSWLMWWNSEEWWSCWIGLIFFGCISSAVKHQIPSPQFLPWEKNPFSTFASQGNYGLMVIFVTMGVLLWISMAATKAPNWRKFPFGFALVFFIALISKMLASNGKS